MAAVLGDSGRIAESDGANGGEAGQPNGDVGTPSGESAADDNISEWTSFGGNGAGGSGYSDPDASTGHPDYSGEPAPFGRFANGKPRKRRAKGAGKTGTGNGKRNPAQEAIPLASLLYSTHFLASKFLVPELELTEDESKTMARALAEVGQYYDVPIVSPQNVAWYNLATTAAMIYGTRFVAYRNRARREAAEKRAPNLTQMQPVMQTGSV